MEKRQLLKKMEMKRTLTKNEKILMTLLGIVILFWAVFRFIITPQNDKLQNLTEKKYEYEEKIFYMNGVLKKENTIDEEWTKLNRERDIITNK